MSAICSYFRLRFLKPLNILIPLRPQMRVDLSGPQRRMSQELTDFPQAHPGHGQLARECVSQDMGVRPSVSTAAVTASNVLRISNRYRFFAHAFSGATR